MSQEKKIRPKINVNICVLLGNKEETQRKEDYNVGSRFVKNGPKKSERERKKNETNQIDHYADNSVITEFSSSVRFILLVYILSIKETKNISFSLSFCICVD